MEGHKRRRENRGKEVSGREEESDGSSEREVRGTVKFQSLVS